MSAAMTKLKTGKITEKTKAGTSQQKKKTYISCGSSGPIIE